MPGNRREAAALATRREILDAARRLFVEQGYGATTVQQVAAEAGVALQTIYSSVGNKAALVLALNDELDHDADVARLATELMSATDAGGILAAAVRLTRSLNEKGRDLIPVLLAAAPSEPDVARAVHDGLTRHREGTQRAAQRIVELGVPAGQTADAVATALDLMTSPASWRQLVERGMSFDQAEEWVLASLRRLVLAEG